MAVRIVLFWAPVILALGVIEIYAGPPDPQALELGNAHLVQVLTTLVSLLAVCSVAVSWHRFILRDETTSGLRLDKNVLKNSKIFEKAEIKWVPVDDLQKMRPQFRSYFQNIVDMMLNQKKSIYAFIKKCQKKQKRTMRAKHRLRKTKRRPA